MLTLLGHPSIHMSRYFADRFLPRFGNFKTVLPHVGFCRPSSILLSDWDNEHTRKALDRPSYPKSGKKVPGPKDGLALFDTCQNPTQTPVQTMYPAKIGA